MDFRKTILDELKRRKWTIGRLADEAMVKHRMSRGLIYRYLKKEGEMTTRNVEKLFDVLDSET